MKKEREEIIKVLAKQQAYGVKRAVPLGNSFAILLPKVWLKFHAACVDGDYYFLLNIEDGNLIIKPITDEDFADVVIKPKSK